MQLDLAQVTDHCHILSRLVLSPELTPQDLARHITPSHGIDVDVSKSCLDKLILACEDTVASNIASIECPSARVVPHHPS